MTSRRSITAFLMASSMLVATPALAQTAPADEAIGDNDIIVTAQKREQNLQSVPLSIIALGTKKLDQLNINSVDRVTLLLPSVSIQTSQPGSTRIYFRGVASGGDGNHSGPLPSVGTYLDEQPVTTIGGTLPIHIYDIARIEALAGPQGTLYGASSQAGTIRIITNKPSTAGFEGRVDGEINTVRNGDIGGRLEGMLNLPISANAAFRVVGWYKRDAGFIDNIPGTRRFLPTVGGFVATNPAFVKKNFNESETYGGRAALKIDLDDTWTVTPTVYYQEQRNKGVFGYQPSVGDLQVQRFYPDFSNDRFVQAALTIEGKIGNWDLTYAGAYLDRKISGSSDYTDYAESYDSLYSSVGGVAGYFYFQNAAGANIDPRQFTTSNPKYRKLSQELRVSSPADERFRVIAGLFYQRQANDIDERYIVPGLAPLLSVNGLPGTLWLTKQQRVDRDYAVFGEASFDITPTVTLTAGGRAFIYDNSLIGFFGFGRDPAFIQGQAGNPPPNAAGSSRTGVAGCFTTEGLTLRDAQRLGRPTTLFPSSIAPGPCTNLGDPTPTGVRPKQADGQGFTHRLNLTWKPSTAFLAYATWSRGFRPGGINRRASVGAYNSDFLTNYELGVKTTLLDGKLRFNVAAYQQDWKTFQFAFLGQNSFTQIQNGPDARIKGIEVDANFAPVTGLTLSASGAYTDAKTRQNLCAINDPTYACTLVGPGGELNYIQTPRGSRLPVTPEFKINGSARYEFALGSSTRAHLQALVAHQSGASADIRLKQFISALNDQTDPAQIADPTKFYSPAGLLGRLRAFTSVDFAAGIDFNRFSAEIFLANAFDERGEVSRGTSCSVCTRVYVNTIAPQTLGLRLGTKF
jgi:iron complex outermembrane recepter protein